MPRTLHVIDRSGTVTPVTVPSPAQSPDLPATDKTCCICKNTITSPHHQKCGRGCGDDICKACETKAPSWTLDGAPVCPDCDAAWLANQV